jgi:hypothetical protein
MILNINYNEYLERIITEMELIHTIKIGEGDSSLALGMTCDVGCLWGKQRRFAKRIASAFPYVT